MNADGVGRDRPPTRLVERGRADVDAPAPDDPDRFTPPVFEYDRDAGKSVTGGYVYRGSEIPWLQGTYVYGDFVDGRIWGLTRAADGNLHGLVVLPRGLHKPLRIACLPTADERVQVDLLPSRLLHPSQAFVDGRQRTLHLGQQHILERPRAALGAPVFGRQPQQAAGAGRQCGQRAEQRVFPQMVERMLMTAPAGADLSWRY